MIFAIFRHPLAIHFMRTFFEHSYQFPLSFQYNFILHIVRISCPANKK